MIEFKLTTEGEEVLNKVSAPRKLMEGVMLSLLTRIGSAVSSEARLVAPQNTGRGLRTISPRIVHEGPASEIVAAGYMVVLDQGRMAGAPMPPVDDIETWVVQRAGRGSFGGGKLSDPKKARRVAFVVARSIGRKGIAARLFFLGSARKVLGSGIIERELEERLERDLRGSSGVR